MSNYVLQADKKYIPCIVCIYYMHAIALTTILIFPWKWRMWLFSAISWPILVQFFFSMFGMIMLKMISMISDLVCKRNFLKNSINSILFLNQIDALKLLFQKFREPDEIFLWSLIWRKISKKLNFLFYFLRKNQHFSVKSMFLQRSYY